MTLGQRFALLSFLISCSLIAILTFQNVRWAKENLDQRITNGSTAIFETLKALCRAQVAAEDVISLKRDLHSMTSLYRIAYINVSRMDGSLVFNERNSNHPLAPSVDDTRTVRVFSDTILHDGQPWGQLLTGMWIAGIEEDTNAVLRDSLFLGLGLAFGAGVLSWFLGRRLGLRLTRFAKNIAQRSPSDCSLYPPPTEQDEVGILIASFNTRQELLQQANEKRLEAETERGVMRDMIVHDLKSPVTILRAGLDALKEMESLTLSAKGARVISMLESATRNLGQMIESILVMASLENSPNAGINEPVSLVPILQQRHSQLQLAAQAKNISLRLEIPKGIDPVTQGDSQSLARVIDNLVSNAIEHTLPEGRIIMRLTAQGGNARIDVEDNGPGVPAEDRDVIFQKFTKGRSGSRGVGLGLAYCRLAVNRHSGTLGVEESPGGGARFYFVLPLTPPQGAIRAS